MHNNLKRSCAFTLIELIVVIIVAGVLAGLALPRYHQVVQRQREQDAVNQLKAVHTANELYRIRAGEYLPAQNPIQHADINTGLGINIISSGGMEYDYVRLDETTYTAIACLLNTGGNCVFAARIDPGALSSANPCCAAVGTKPIDPGPTVIGTCPTLPGC